MPSEYQVGVLHCVYNRNASALVLCLCIYSFVMFKMHEQCVQSYLFCSCVILLNILVRVEYILRCFARGKLELPQCMNTNARKKNPGCKL